MLGLIPHVASAMTAHRQKAANHAQECARPSLRRGHHPPQGPTPSPNPQTGNCPESILIPATVSILMGTISDGILMGTLSDEIPMDIISDEILMGNMHRYRNIW